MHWVSCMIVLPCKNSNPIVDLAVLTCDAATRLIDRRLKHSSLDIRSAILILCTISWTQIYMQKFAALSKLLVNTMP
jgi:hypothetical protein